MVVLAKWKSYSLLLELLFFEEGVWEIWEVTIRNPDQQSEVPLCFPLQSDQFLAFVSVVSVGDHSFDNFHFYGLFRSLLPALSCVQTALLHLLDMGWEPSDLTFFVDIQLPDLLMKMSQENISVHDSVIR